MILSVTFRAKQLGITSISFDRQSLKDSSNVDIAVDSWNGITLDINEAQDISADPLTTSFEEIALGGQTAPVTFTITNVSQSGQSMDLEVGTILITGTDPDDFLIQNDTCSGQNIPGSNSCTLDVLFAPASAGARLADLSILSNDPDTPTLNIPLDGRGVSTLIVTIDPDAAGTVTGPGIDCPADCTENNNQSGRSRAAPFLRGERNESISANRNDKT